mmetsp:Transcript_10356/g.21295  ORF Transcript_10356/g.21295 Transcript_10356/m.21295 type:complete len:210 (-) Transcript_10356:158-787(-)
MDSLPCVPAVGKALSFNDMLVTADTTVVSSDELAVSSLRSEGAEGSLERTQSLSTYQKSEPNNDDNESASSGENIMMEIKKMECTDNSMGIQVTSVEDMDETESITTGQKHEETVKRVEYETEVLDVKTLMSLLEPSKKAAEKIAGKNIVLLIGGTGAGKTTTALYLAGSSFEVTDVDGNNHFHPKSLPFLELEQFVVGSGDDSVNVGC